MEFVEGESLEKALAHRRMTESQVRDIAMQVLDVLIYLQGLSPRVIHRDVKPANLIVRPDGKIALVDFGSARGTAGTLGATIDVGTYGYMPPEQLAGEVDATSDVYALGATLLHVLTRVPPRELLGSDREASIRKHVQASPALRRWLERALSVRREDRFADAAAARAELLHPKPVAGERAWKPRHVGRARRAAAFAIAAALAILGTALLTPGSPLLAAFQSRPATVQADPSTDPMQNEFAHEVLTDGPSIPITKMPGWDAIKAEAAPEVLQKLEAIDKISLEGSKNLEAIFLAEKAYKVRTGHFLAFEKGNAATWKELKLVLPHEAHHEFTGWIADDGHLVLLASGNLDGDAFLDRWHIEGSVPGSPVRLEGLDVPMQDDNDALNIEYDSGKPHLNSGPNGKWGGTAAKITPN
jgi:hypothetical protein